MPVNGSVHERGGVVGLAQPQQAERAEATRPRRAVREVNDPSRLVDRRGVDPSQAAAVHAYALLSICTNSSVSMTGMTSMRPRSDHARAACTAIR